MLKIIQINLQHSKAATAFTSRPIKAGDGDIMLIEETCLMNERIPALGIGGSD